MDTSFHIALGIETSCDETSISLVSSKREILSNQIYTQADHERFGGVVPELASRAHLERLPYLLKTVLKEARLSLLDVNVITVAGGPGLIGGILVGVMYAKALAAALNKPFIALNHLEGHALTIRLTSNIEFPYLLLLVSGGHTQLLWVKGVGQYELLGTTLDDAIGEAFDKTAKLLDLGYPGGALLERAALKGDPLRFAFPRPLSGTKHCNFSFSGLKTAVRQKVENLPFPLSLQDQYDISASFQLAACESLLDRCKNAIILCKKNQAAPFPFVISGGVASNSYLRDRLEKLTQDFDLSLKAPPINLCTDNGAMIAWAGLERFNLGLLTPLDFAPRPRWPLEEPLN